MQTKGLTFGDQQVFDRRSSLHMTSTTYCKLLLLGMLHELHQDLLLPQGQAARQDNFCCTKNLIDGLFARGVNDLL